MHASYILGVLTAHHPKQTLCDHNVLEINAQNLKFSFL